MEPSIGIPVVNLSMALSYLPFSDTCRVVRASTWFGKYVRNALRRKTTLEGSDVLFLDAAVVRSIGAMLPNLTRITKTDFPAASRDAVASLLNACPALTNLGCGLQPLLPRDFLELTGPPLALTTCEIRLSWATVPEDSHHSAEVGGVVQFTVRCGPKLKCLQISKSDDEKFSHMDRHILWRRVHAAKLTRVESICVNYDDPRRKLIARVLHNFPALKGMSLMLSSKYGLIVLEDVSEYGGKTLQQLELRLARDAAEWFMEKEHARFGIRLDKLRHLEELVFHIDWTIVEGDFEYFCKNLCERNAQRGKALRVLLDFKSGSYVEYNAQECMYAELPDTVMEERWLPAVNEKYKDSRVTFEKLPVLVGESLYIPSLL